MLSCLKIPELNSSRRFDYEKIFLIGMFQAKAF